MCTIILIHGAPAVGKSSLDHPPQGLPQKDTKKHLKVQASLFDAIKEGSGDTNLAQF